MFSCKSAMSDAGGERRNITINLRERRGRALHLNSDKEQGRRNNQDAIPPR